MAVDRQLIVIIIFLVITFTVSGILVTGVVPKIFQNQETLNQTEKNLNSTQEKVSDIKNEVFNQRPIVVDSNKTINLLNKTFYTFLKDDLNRSETIQQELAARNIKLQKAETKLSLSIANITTDIKNISKQNNELIHFIVKPLMDDLQKSIDKIDFIVGKINDTTIETKIDVKK